MRFPKKKPLRDPKYLARVRELPCCACGYPPPSQAHHEIGSKKGGMGMKVGDDRTMPLCPICHAEIHLMGHVTWESIHGKQVKHIEDTEKKLK